jgi:5-formyltetrahydrofolate cyclo-ligase
MKILRDRLSSDEIDRRSEAICERLMNLNSLQSAQSLFTYVSCRSEVHTHDFIRSMLKKDMAVTVPKVVSRGEMQAHRLLRWAQLQPGAFGILEPQDATIYEGPIDLCVAPGLAFTPAGDRLGYGRGHYDRFVARHSEMLVVAIAFEVQLLDWIPTEPTDHRVNMIITEDRVIET